MAKGTVRAHMVAAPRTWLPKVAYQESVNTRGHLVLFFVPSLTYLWVKDDLMVVSLVSLPPFPTTLSYLL